MDINNDDVESIRTIGQLNEEDVKIIKTYGGLNIAIGKKSKKSKKLEALAAGSHQALVAHQLFKDFGNTFHPAIFKSESEQLESVDDFTNLLPQPLQDKGYGLFTLSKNDSRCYVLSKRNFAIGEFIGEKHGDKLILKSMHLNKDMNDSSLDFIAQSLTKLIETSAEKEKLTLNE